MSYYASLAKIASAEAALGAPIALEDSLVLKQLVVALGNVTGGGGGGAGTVTSFSFTDGAGISGVVTNPTTTPALALTLGAITPTSVNGLTLAAAAVGFTIAGGTTSKTLTISNTLTLAGTDASTLNIGAGGTLGTAAFTAASDYALIASANTFSAANIFSVNGAASTSAVRLTGAILSGGTGTTNFPHLFIQPTGATAATTWNTSGTVIGVNAATGFSGNFFDFRVAGSQKAYLNANAQFLATDIQSSSTFTLNGSVGNGVFGMYHLATLGWSSSVVNFSTTAASLDLVLVRKAAATLQLGLDAAGVTNQMFTAASRITSNGAGANLTIAGGNCRGTTGEGGVGGSLIFSTYAASVTTNTIGTLTTRMTITTTGAIILESLPTSDPGVPGQLYKVAGAVMQSA